MYRFVLSPRWIGLGLLMTLAAVAMIGLGVWQLDRFHYRTAINDRIDAAAAAAPVPLASVLRPPAARAGAVGPDAPGDAAWTRVSVSGRYDPAHQIVAHSRTVDGNVGFEVLTPLLLGDATAILVDRGWIPPPPDGATTPTSVPPAPAGEVTVLGRIHAAESRPDSPQPVGTWLTVRRVAPASIAPVLPYGVYGAYVTLDTQQPAADPTFVPVSPDYENAAMNAGYVAQWWVFALLTLAGFGYLVVKEARLRALAVSDQPVDLAAAHVPAAAIHASKVSPI